MQVSYVTNESGKKTAVQIPLKKWEEIERGMKKLEFIDELLQAFNEMKLYKAGKISTPGTAELLSEL